MSDSAGPFFVYFPAWTVINLDLFDMLGFTSGIVPVGSPRIDGVMMPLFTDESLAARFIDESKAARWTTFKIETFTELKGILRQLVGVTYVGIDFSAGSNPRGEAGRYYTIQDILDA